MKTSVKLIFLLGLVASSLLLTSFYVKTAIFGDKKPVAAAVLTLKKINLPDKIDFNLHVKPILSDRCFKCHGPDKNKIEAGLQLTNFEGATALLKSGKRAVVPFKPKESELITRIFSTDPTDMMPSPKSNLALTETEKAILVKWIEQGGEYKEHWSFVVPFRYPVPMAHPDGSGSPSVNSLKNGSWARSSIDFFILQKLEENGLTPAKEASKETLIRRLSLDLTGLPPTVAEIQDFVNNSKPNAYERLVDRLLATPQYGERLALDWLDVARYADSHGYQDDGLRNAYPYRDWVIRAFNQNLSFDKFATWQLGGDLLKNPTEDQLIATCFNRNHQQSQEGGVVDEEYRIEYVADRVATFGKAFLGLTTECARCHTHKYDPITHNDYYSLFAFFNQNNDTGIVPYSGEATPTLLLKTPNSRKSLDSLRQLMQPYEAKTQVSEQYKKDLGAWLKNLKANYNAALETPVKRVVYLDFEKEDTTLIRDNINPPTKIELENRAKARAESLKDSTKKVKPLGKIAGFWNIETADTMLKAATYSGDKDKRPLSIEGKKGKGLHFQGDAGLEMGKALNYDRYQPFSVSIWVKVMKEGEAGPIFNKSNGDFEGYRGWLCILNKDGTLSFQFNHVWPDNAIDFQTIDKIKIGEWTHIALTYDGSSKASGVHFWLNGKTPQYKLWTDNLQKSILHTRNKGNKNWSPLNFSLGSELRQTIQNVEMDELQIFKRQLSEIEVSELSGNQALTSLLEKPSRSEKEEKQLLEWFLLRGHNADFNASIDSLISLRGQENDLMTDLEEVMTMHDRAEYRKTYILSRGAYDAPTTEEVFPRTPTKFPSFEGFPKNRLGLAQWLLDDKNPLFARVIANRYWQMLFGRGIVATQEDFGNQGALPTHLELLDYLALDFKENGWDVKRFLKQMVMSATYRQSSVPTAAAKETDALNLFYSHYPAHRLSAELVRDNALAASGLLVKKIGGQSVYPYQPDGLWEALATRNAKVYTQNHGDSLYRRSLYTIWKRSAPPPAMINFDATDRAFCVVRRQKTASPLQALVLMNDPQFVEASRILAEKMMLISKSMPEKSGQDPSVSEPKIVENTLISKRLTYGFEALTSRKPRPSDLSELVLLFEKQKKHFAENPENAEKLLTVGEFPRDKKLDAVEVAAYTVVASMMMNFDEFVVKR